MQVGEMRHVSKHEAGCVTGQRGSKRDRDRCMQGPVVETLYGTLHDPPNKP